MTWKDRLKKASFRGVEFFVDTSDTDFGRRNKVFEYPKRDIPFAEDLGKKARRYNFNAYICIGPFSDDYIPQRDRLITAIEEKEKPGTLVHPTLGSLEVVPGECRVTYNTQDGGIEYFQLEFVQAGENRFPEGKTRTNAKLVTDADAAVEAAKASFENLFNVTKKPAFLTDDASQVNGLFVTKLNAMTPDVPDTLADQQSAISTLTSNLTTLLQNPEDYGDTVTDIIGRVPDLFTKVKPGYDALRKLLDFTSTLRDIPATTATRRQQQTNRDSQVGLITQTALAEMARTTADLEFDSYEDAVNHRNDVADNIDAEVLRLGDTDEDELVFALETLRSTVILDLTERAASLVRLKNIQIQATLPALTVAYDLYEDSERDTEIIARNKIRHPGFLPPGQDLQVLSA